VGGHGWWGMATECVKGRVAGSFPAVVRCAWLSAVGRCAGWLAARARYSGSTR
jgi:hypothetical protein